MRCGRLARRFADSEVSIAGSVSAPDSIESSTGEAAATGSCGETAAGDDGVKRSTVGDRAFNPILVRAAQMMRITRAYFELSLDDLLAGVLPGGNLPTALQYQRAVSTSQHERRRRRRGVRGES